MSRIPAAILCTAALTFMSGASPAAAADFSANVREILDHQTDGPLAEMDGAKRTAMTACVVQTLQRLPKGKQKYITDGTNLEEREHRFGKIVDDNHAEWRQKIAAACAEIAMDQGANSSN